LLKYLFRHSKKTPKLITQRGPVRGRSPTDLLPQDLARRPCEAGSRRATPQKGSLTDGRRGSTTNEVVGISVSDRPRRSRAGPVWGDRGQTGPNGVPRVGVEPRPSTPPTNSTGSGVGGLILLWGSAQNQPCRWPTSHPPEKLWGPLKYVFPNCHYLFVIISINRSKCINWENE
jgi:hypothetical protein